MEGVSACSQNECGLDKYRNIVQLHDKDKSGNEHPVYPVTCAHAVYGRDGANLENMLAQFNNMFLQYQGTAKDTRLLLPKEMRRKGVQISYRNMDDEVVTEKCVNDTQSDNDHWGLDANWMRIDELSLQGEISVSSKGTWVINGEDTGIKALGPKGDNGLTPWMKTIDNKLHYSYDNKIWVPVSDYISAWFRFTGTPGSSQAGNIGKIQISRDNGKTWADLSGEFTNDLKIRGYRTSVELIPAGQPQGAIWGIGPTYEESDTEHTNPIYRLYVKDGNGWVDNGRFTGITAGVVQELGDSETEVVSQKVVTRVINSIEEIVEYGITNKKIINSLLKELYIDGDYTQITTIKIGVGVLNDNGLYYNSLYLLKSDESYAASSIEKYYNTLEEAKNAWDGIIQSNDGKTIIICRNVFSLTGYKTFSDFEFNYPPTLEYCPSINLIIKNTLFGISDSMIVNYLIKELYLPNNNYKDITKVSLYVARNLNNLYYTGLYFYNESTTIGGFEKSFSNKEEALNYWLGIKSASNGNFKVLLQNVQNFTGIISNLPITINIPTTLEYCPGISNDILQPSSNNPLQGKIVVFDGDSICYGVGYTGGYGNIIATKNSMQYQNLGVGGATIASNTYSDDSTPRHWICQSVDNLREDADYVIVEGGVNDASLGVSLGSISDGYTRILDETTFYGAFESMLRKLLVKFPGKKIGYIFVHQMTQNFRHSNDEASSYYWAARKCCEKWGIPFCDLNTKCPAFGLFTQDNAGLYSLRTTYTYNGDGWHPNELGYKKYYCDKIESWMKSL